MYRFAGASVQRFCCCDVNENRRWTDGVAMREWPQAYGNQVKSGRTKITSGRLLAGFPQQDSAQAIIGAVAEQALHAAAGLMLKPFLPQPSAMA